MDVKTVRLFIGGKGDHLSGAPLIKWSPGLALVVAKVCDLRARHWGEKRLLCFPNKSSGFQKPGKAATVTTLLRN